MEPPEREAQDHQEAPGALFRDLQHLIGPG